MCWTTAVKQFQIYILLNHYQSVTNIFCTISYFTPKYIFRKQHLTGGTNNTFVVFWEPEIGCTRFRLKGTSMSAGVCVNMAPSFRIKCGLLSTRTLFCTKIIPHIARTQTEVMCLRSATHSASQHDEKYCIDLLR